MRLTMLQIVRFFFCLMSAFCLTIAPVYADEQQIVMPQIIIDLSSLAARVYQQQAMLGFFAFGVGVFVAIAAYDLLNRQPTKSPMNQGDQQAKKISLVWVAFLLLLVSGFALPVLRVMSAVIKGS